MSPPVLEEHFALLGRRNIGGFGKWEIKRELSDHLMFKRVPQKLSVSCDVKRLHHAVFVKGDRAWFYVDYTCNLLHRQSTREQLQDLTLPFRNPFLFYKRLSFIQKEGHRLLRK